MALQQCVKQMAEGLKTDDVSLLEQLNCFVCFVLDRFSVYPDQHIIDEHRDFSNVICALFDSVLSSRGTGLLTYVENIDDTKHWVRSQFLGISSLLSQYIDCYYSLQALSINLDSADDRRRSLKIIKGVLTRNNLYSTADGLQEFVDRGHIPFKTIVPNIGDFRTGSIIKMVLSSHFD